jgi:MFS family permease
MYIGSISGLIIMNIISDKYGRKFSFLIALVTSVFGALCKYLLLNKL